MTDKHYTIEPPAEAGWYWVIWGCNGAPRRLSELECLAIGYRRSIERIQTPREIAELREERDELRRERDTYKRALRSVSTWREDAHESDEEIGEPPRDFVHEEDWDLLEEFARDVLEKIK
jgi:hypothetical protein